MTQRGSWHVRRRAVLSCVGVALLFSGFACADQRAGTANRDASEEHNQTLEEFLGLDDASLVRQRDLRQHNELETLTQECMRAQGFEYTRVPPLQPSSEDLSPQQYARTLGFGVAAMYLGLDDDIGVLEEPRDPNGTYIESLNATDRTRFFQLHARCVDRANEAVLGPIEDAREAVQPFLDASNKQMAADSEYVVALNEWEMCLESTTGIQADSMEDVRAYVATELVPLGDRLAKEHDVQGLRDLLQREIEVATAASECGTAFQERVAPLIAKYEGDMLRAHPDEFNRLLEALNGDGANGRSGSSP